MHSQMRIFWVRLLLFTSPWVAYCLAIYLVDPFCFLNAPAIISPQVKFPIANQLNPCLWKMHQFRGQPVGSILLGDSRMDSIRASEVSAAAGEPYFNLAYGGATLREVVDTFWFAQRQTRLRNVFIGINLNLYTGSSYAERTKTYLTIESNPAIYFVNRSVLEAAWDDVYSKVSGVDLHLGVPKMSREEFWQLQLGPGIEPFYSQYSYPDRYKNDLQTIAEFCRGHGIRLVFIIFPTHVDLQNRIQDFHLSAAATRLRDDLSSMADTYDFDFPSDLTRDKQNFMDPFHFNHEIGSRLISEIWGRAPLTDGVQLSGPSQISAR